MLRIVSLLVLLVHGGCAAAAGDGAGRGTQIRVTDIKSVAGRWVGLSDLPGHRSDDQYIEVTLRDDGSLLIQGSNGASGTATLYSAGGKPTLLVEMARGTMRGATARLRPKP